MKSLFELNDTLYAEAQVEETGEVYLWLGVSRVFSVTSFFKQKGPLRLPGVSSLHTNALIYLSPT